MSPTVPASLPTPSIRRRLASMLYESVLLIAVLFFGFLVPNVALGMLGQIILPIGIVRLYLFALIGAYFVWSWRRGGQTLPMKTWKIRLVAADGGAPGMDQLLLRFLLAALGILCFGVGLIWGIFDRDRQFLHDRLSGTRLVLVG